MPADSAEQFDIPDAKANLSRIIDRVEQGEEIVISRGGTPVAKVVPLTRQVARKEVVPCAGASSRFPAGTPPRSTMQ